MALDPGAVGRRADPTTYRWNDRDTLLYALAVGVGPEPDDVPFCTENSAGIAQRVLPTFAAVACYDMALLDDIGEYDRSRLVHAAMRVRVHEPLPPAGELRVESAVTDVVDRGAGRNASVSIGLTGTDTATGRRVVENESTVVIRGAGGFGGEPGPPRVAGEPATSTPDLELATSTRADQALLYRLTGDRNPLHSDPGYARSAGFPGPILHGLCTFGTVGRQLLRALCGDAVERFAELSVRFSSPVHPGDEILTSVWHSEPGLATFRTEAAAPSSGPRTVLTDGRFLFRQP